MAPWRSLVAFASLVLIVAAQEDVPEYVLERIRRGSSKSDSDRCVAKGSGSSSRRSWSSSQARECAEIVGELPPCGEYFSSPWYY